MECPSCLSLIPSSSIYYVNRAPRIICGSCGFNVTALLEDIDSLTLPPPSPNAQGFAPVALDRKKVNGEYIYSYPGSNADLPSPGYERIHLTSLPAIDKHVKAESAKEQEVRTYNLAAERAVWDERTKARREHIRGIIRDKGFSGKYFDATCKAIDHHREKKYTEMQRRQVSFHNQAMSFDQSNRQGYRDDTIGKRDR